MQNEEVKKILDYWTALEMLIPNPFPDVRTEESDKIIHRLICDKITKGKKYRIFLKKIGRPMPRMLKSAVILIYATENLKFRIYTIYYVVSCMLKIQKLI